ncbi:MAG: CoA transferase [Limimaricola sp.]|uniref:CaiB/BaiF CoA transferase family protein n=1 Tax=Limimaricola sp. TaxID=2211665 RepID=UPI001DC6AC7E|nr:CaiB/BaiF CoA-transferase family protein [Limimaricola sp.]MBI1416769.1 CoA transferase [Limimaricola sp.]
MTRPLEGLLVVDFSQFLSGPLCALKLADLGARVIKIERPGQGDLCRTLYLSDTEIGGTNSLFHAINRNKESFAADLRDEGDRARLRRLVAKADVVMQNFRPGVIERMGFGYDAVRALNPDIVYGSISGYGDEGPWVDLPGQDLLAQARSGLLWLTGSAGDPPMPMGLAVADMLAGNALAQGILAALVGRGLRGEGAKVETSLLEALLDFQFEVLTTHLNDGGKLPRRAAVGGAHAYLGAPYGVYQTADGYLALAMTPSLRRLAELMGIAALAPYLDDPAAAMRERDAIKAIIAQAVRGQTTAHWLAILQPADIWCSEVLDWPGLFATEAFRRLNFIQTIENGAVSLSTLRGPLRLDGAALTSGRAAPGLGQHTQEIIDEFGLNRTDNGAADADRPSETTSRPGNPIADTITKRRTS